MELREILAFALEGQPLHGEEAKILAEAFKKAELDLVNIGSSLSDFFFQQYPDKEAYEKAEKNLQIWSQYT